LTQIKASRRRERKWCGSHTGDLAMPLESILIVAAIVAAFGAFAATLAYSMTH